MIRNDASRSQTSETKTTPYFDQIGTQTNQSERSDSRSVLEAGGPGIPCVGSCAGRGFFQQEGKLCSGECGDFKALHGK